MRSGLPRDFRPRFPYAFTVPISDDKRPEIHEQADRASVFFARMVENGHSRDEAAQLTVAYLLGHKVELQEPEPREPWQLGDTTRGERSPSRK